MTEEQVARINNEIKVAREQRAKMRERQREIERLTREHHKRRMHGLHVHLCLDAANEVDPFRGWDWVAEFETVAVKLGYVFDGKIPCVCGCNPHTMTCRLVKPL